MTGPVVNLRALRTDRGLTIRQLAEETGLSEAVIQRAETGSSIHVANAKVLADYYGYERPSEIWPIDGEPAAA